MGRGSTGLMPGGAEFYSQWSKQLKTEDHIHKAVTWIFWQGKKVQVGTNKKVPYVSTDSYEYIFTDHLAQSSHLGRAGPTRVCKFRQTSLTHRELGQLLKSTGQELSGPVVLEMISAAEFCRVLMSGSRDDEGRSREWRRVVVVVVVSGRDWATVFNFNQLLFWKS